MRITGFGLRTGLFYLVMIGAFFATPYSNLFFLLLGFLTLLSLASAYWTPRNLRGITAQVSTLEPFPAESPQQLAITLEAPGRRRYQISIDLHLVGGPRVFGQTALLDERAEVRVPIPPLERGIWTVRHAWLATGYPLGLFEARRNLPGITELVVHPRPSARHDARGGSDTLAAILGEKARGAGDLQPAGLRDHHEGDELRSVHWRASARRGTLVVKEWEGGGGGGIELLIDRRAEPEALETALSQATAILALAREKKELLVLTSQGLQATFGEGHRPWSEALRFLALADGLPPHAPAPPPVAPSVTRLPLAEPHVR